MFILNAKMKSFLDFHGSILDLEKHVTKTKKKIWKIYLYSMLNKPVKISVPLRNLKLNLYEAFFSCQISHEKRLEMLAESKKTRVPGKPRHFIDCYLDELDKVCVCDMKIMFLTAI